MASRAGGQAASQEAKLWHGQAASEEVQAGRPQAGGPEAVQKREGDVLQREGALLQREEAVAEQEGAVRKAKAPTRGGPGELKRRRATLRPAFSGPIHLRLVIDSNL